MSHLAQARTAIQKITTARESVRSAWRECESATFEIEQARRQARTDVPPEPGRAALDLARDELRRTERKTKAKENLQTVVVEASREISDAEAEAYRHLAEHTATITGDPVFEARISRAWMSAVRQVDAGVDWSTILANAEAGHDLDTVRALRAELGGWAMAKAGASKEAQFQAAEQRTAAERDIDAVLATIGRGDERTAAEIRLAVATESEAARAVLGPIGKAAASGSMSPSDRMSLGYAQAAVG